MHNIKNTYVYSCTSLKTLLYTGHVAPFPRVWTPEESDQRFASVGADAEATELTSTEQSNFLQTESGESKRIVGAVVDSE